MRAEQADLFGLEIDVLTPEQAQDLRDEVDRENPSRDRVSIGSDEDESTELAPPDLPEADGELVVAARAYEFLCAGCFLIWHRRLLGDEGRQLCSDCADVTEAA